MAIPREELIPILAAHGIKDGIATERDFVEFEVQFYTDYWVTCFSRFLSPRLAVDFVADSVLIVNDYQEFQNRLKKAFRKIPPYRAMHQGKVVYFDPYLPNCNVKSVPLIKPFKYYYQHEYRFFWFPKKSLPSVDDVDIEMGFMGDICEIVTW